MSRWNVRKLSHMPTIEPVKRSMMSLQIETHSMHGGWIEGLTNNQEHPRFDLSGHPREAVLVEIVTNAVEWCLEAGAVDEALIRHDVGLMCGYLLRGGVEVVQ